MNPISQSKVWYITGATGGLGLALAEKALQQGHKVAGTSRDLKKFEKTGLVAKYGDRFLPLETDLQNETILRETINKTVQVFGKIDCVVNNSGYAQPGAIEEISNEEYRANFDVNFFAPLNVMRNVIPQLRKQQLANPSDRAHIFNVASIVGFSHFYGCSAYSSSKFALIGATETLAQELKPYNIKCTAICPGTFLTPILGAFPTTKTIIPEYDSANFIKVWLDRRKGEPLGDSEKYAEIVVSFANKDDAPLHLFIGPDAVDVAQTQLDSIQKELDSYKKDVVKTALPQN